MTHQHIMITTFHLFLLLNIQSTFLVSALMKNATASRETNLNDVIFSQCIVFDKMATSAVYCSAICRLAQGCLSFTYNKSTGMCRGYSVDSTFFRSSASNLGAKNYLCESCSPLPVQLQGWIVFQRRQDATVDFFRTWDEYVYGFGEPCGNYWMGLETLYQMTSTGSWDLRIELGDWQGNTAYAIYTDFYITDGADFYRLMYKQNSYSGTAGDSLAVSRNMQFSTWDNDHDTGVGWNCANNWRGGWWFNNCHYSHLNGEYQPSSATAAWAGVLWYDWKGSTYSLKYTEMKMKRVA